MKVYDVLAEAIEELGYTHTYTIPGTHIYHLNHTLQKRKVENIIFRHEMGTTIAADAYGRLTGEPGLAIDTAGPGILNGLTGLGQAFAEASPLLYITGETRTDEYYGFHGVDKPLYTARSSEAISKSSYIMTSVSEAKDVIYWAYQLSRGGRRGPIHIAIPYNILQSDIESTDRKREWESHTLEMSGEISNFIASRYRGRKTLMIIGPELYPEDKDLIQKLLKDEIILSTTSMTGYIPQKHQGYLGFIEKNFQIYPAGINAVKQADIVVGLGIDYRSPEINLLKRINPDIEVDTVQMSWKHRVSDFWTVKMEKPTIMKHMHGYAFRCNIKSFLEAYLSSQRRTLNIDITKEKSKRLSQALNIVGKEKTDVIHQGRLAYKLSQLDIEDYVITCDTGGNEQWIREFIAPHIQVRYLYSGGFGAIGYSLPASIGAFKALDKTQYRGVLSVVGDGSLMMSLQELKTIVEYNMNIKIIVFNDSTYGILEMLSIRDIGEKLEGGIGAVNFAKIAEALGMEAMRIDKEEDLDNALKQLIRSSKPMLIDAVSSPKEIPTLLRRE